MVGEDGCIPLVLQVCVGTLKVYKWLKALEVLVTFKDFLL